MLLNELRHLYNDNKFIIGQYNHKYKTVISPKEVIIKEDLTVWHDGGCIINGMKDMNFLHSKNDVKSVKDQICDEINKDDEIDHVKAKLLKTFNTAKKRL